MRLTAEQDKVLQAAVGRLLQPSDEAAAGEWKAAIAQCIAEQLDPETSERAEGFTAGLDSLAAESWAVFGCSLLDLHGGQQDELLARVEDGMVRTKWRMSPRDFIEMLVKLTDEGARRLESGGDKER
jgi:hypothetical protein